MRGFVSEEEFGFVRIDNAEDICLRSYQEQCVEALRANIREGIQTQILASMVGSGKTVIAAYLLRECWQKGRRGMFIVDRISLLSQTSAVLDRYGIPHGCIQSGHPRWMPGELIQVASIQTLAKRGWRDADLIIVDESHVIHATHKRMMEQTKGKVIGLTATPFTKGLGKLFKRIVNVTTGNKLTAEGFLVPYKVWAANEPDMTGAKVVAGEWTDAEASQRATKIIGDVVAEYQKRGEDRKAICFGVDVAHCEEMQRQFLRAGINAALYTYRTQDEEREMMLREFRKPDSAIRILISVAALSRGFDVPDVGCIIMCRPLKNSFAEFVQILGRGLRSHPSKESCVILDLSGNFMRHYPALVEFMEDGVNELDDGKPKPKKESKPRERKPMKCPRCTHVWPGGSHCPSCGFQMPVRKSVEHAAGTLGAFDGSHVIKLDREAKRRLYAELSYMKMIYHPTYKPGWISWMFKRITGVWPQGVRDEVPCPPGRDTLEAVRKLAFKGARKPIHASQPNQHPQRAELDLFA